MVAGGGGGGVMTSAGAAAGVAAAVGAGAIAVGEHCDGTGRHFLSCQPEC